MSGLKNSRKIPKAQVLETEKKNKKNYRFENSYRKF